MNQTARDAANSYMREWRAKNPEKCREYRRKYWEKRAGREAGEPERTEQKCKRWTSEEAALAQSLLTALQGFGEVYIRRCVGWGASLYIFKENDHSIGRLPAVAFPSLKANGERVLLKDIAEEG